MRQAVVRILAVSSLLTLLIGAATHLDPIPEGLSAEYFSNAAETGTAAGAAVATVPSTRDLIAEWNESPPDTFSQRWTGEVSALRDATYVFSVESDADASIIIDGQVIAEQTTGQPALENTGRADGYKPHTAGTTQRIHRNSRKALRRLAKSLSHCQIERHLRETEPMQWATRIKGCLDEPFQ